MNPAEPSWISLPIGVAYVCCVLFGALVGWLFGYHAGRQDERKSKLSEDLDRIDDEVI
jgi:hypothetical protein